MARKLTVVISQHQGKDPRKRQLEEELAARLIVEPGVDVSLVPHLYDMQADHTGLLFLRGVPGHIIVLSWLYPRGTRWVLDRQGIRGHEGPTLLVEESDNDEDEPVHDEHPDAIGSVDVPNRKIYCLDLRVRSKADDFVAEVRRIVSENAEPVVSLMSWIGGSPQPVQVDRFLNAPADGVKEHPINGNGRVAAINGEAVNGEAVKGTSAVQSFADDPVKRRWYPVIDYSRCTNCMECIDFCLFGVYGVDTLDRILVEAQDNCKKGCPACSRVCPENAIVFPQHKTPAIAGADGEVAGLKIDLTKLFGGDPRDALEIAAAERDAELVKDGRDAVGLTVGIPKRQSEAKCKPRDELDDLMDSLNALDV
jgi:NAD-dependent dihydropyrimidine dehydrogenase PreA subunit